MSLETEILLNQIAQGVRSVDEGLHLITRSDAAEDLWLALRMMIRQAHPTALDVEEAIVSAGLKPTYTPCVLLLKDQRPHQTQRVTALPENEFEKAFRLLLAVFVIADRRRQQSCPVSCQHGWHHDFADADVLAEIRERGYI